MCELNEIKQLVKEIVETNRIKNKAPTKESRRIDEKIFDSSMSIITEQKMKKPSFTIFNNPAIRRYKVDKCDVNSSEPAVDMISFLTENLEAWYELTSIELFKRKKKYRNENHVFYMSVYSSRLDRLNDVYFVSYNSQFMLLEDSMTDMTLYDFCSKYLADISSEIKKELDDLACDRKRKHTDVQIELINIAKRISQTEKDKKEDFVKGVITFMDFLGWKGLWQNRDNKVISHLEKVSELLKEINEDVKKLTKDVFKYSVDIEISRMISISDTIAIFTPEITECDRIVVLELHARITEKVLEKCVKLHYPIRGAITFGKYNVKNNMMIGPGIDECASWHEACNWIGVHFCPSAEFIIDLCDSDEYKHIERFDIPVKNGYPKPKYCVKWTVDRESFIGLIEEAQALLPEISSKYINTYNFLYERGKEDYAKDDIS